MYESNLRFYDNCLRCTKKGTDKCFFMAFSQVHGERNAITLFLQKEILFLPRKLFSE